MNQGSDSGAVRAGPAAAWHCGVCTAVLRITSVLIADCARVQISRNVLGLFSMRISWISFRDGLFLLHIDEKRRERKKTETVTKITAVTVANHSTVNVKDVIAIKMQLSDFKQLDTSEQNKKEMFRKMFP